VKYDYLDCTLKQNGIWSCVTIKLTTSRKNKKIASLDTVFFYAIFKLNIFSTFARPSKQFPLFSFKT
jgi:hypothetical protein